MSALPPETLGTIIGAGILVVGVAMLRLIDLAAWMGRKWMCEWADRQPGPFVGR